MSKPVNYHYGKFPPTNLKWTDLIPHIGPASGSLARYDGLLSSIPNPAVLLSPLTTQEAVLSSRIEGTQATMGEILEYEAEGATKDISPEKEADIHEVLNYRKAVWGAIKSLKKLPLCQRIITDTHRILLEGVRGHKKSPGEYRKAPNWIGPPGSTVKDARFVPIDARGLIEGMSEWEKYIHMEAPDQLVQLAILHAEFEALHPFLDGNGRLGRMFVPLFLFKVGLIQSPMFYISAYLEANREEYCERLLAVSRDDNWTDWCIFFLKTIKIQAENNQQKAKRILELYEAKKNQVIKLTRSQYAIHSLDFIFERPIFTSSSFVNFERIPRSTATRILAKLRDKKILTILKEGRGRRSRVYAFRELLNIAEGKKVF
ncbi:MAG: Fic family protein [Planctomycetota bacterium]|jgi:Fic family protein